MLLNLCIKLASGDLEACLKGLDIAIPGELWREIITLNGLSLHGAPGEKLLDSLFVLYHIGLSLVTIHGFFEHLFC